MLQWLWPSRAHQSWSLTFDLLRRFRTSRLHCQIRTRLNSRRWNRKRRTHLLSSMMLYDLPQRLIREIKPGKMLWDQAFESSTYCTAIRFTRWYHYWRFPKSCGVRVLVFGAVYHPSKFLFFYLNLSNQTTHHSPNYYRQLKLRTLPSKGFQCYSWTLGGHLPDTKVWPFYTRQTRTQGYMGHLSFSPTTILCWTAQ